MLLKRLLGDRSGSISSILREGNVISRSCFVKCFHAGAFQRLTAMSSELPSLRWGIVSTGMISSWFASDIVRPRPDAKARHIIQAVGSSSVEKGRGFVTEHLGNVSPAPTVYGSYEEVYADPDVDIVYIGTPHAFHKQNALDAIAAGKHVLCEKAITLNAQEAEEVIEAARSKGSFLMEAMWTRFFPLVKELRRQLFEVKAIGQIHRVFADFGLDIDIASLPATSRYKDPALGAGSLLDVGIYSLTWGLLLLDENVGSVATNPEVFSAQTLQDGVDVNTSFILNYPQTGRQGILTSTTNYQTGRDFVRVEGSEGTIIIDGVVPSNPVRFTVKKEKGDGWAEVKTFVFKKPGIGLYYEADAVVLDIKAGRKESSVMPWAETLRVMKIMDGIRARGGTTYPQDDQ